MSRNLYKINQSSRKIRKKLKKELLFIKKFLIKRLAILRKSEVVFYKISKG